MKKIIILITVILSSLSNAQSIIYDEDGDIVKYEFENNGHDTEINSLDIYNRLNSNQFDMTHAINKYYFHSSDKLINTHGYENGSVLVVEDDTGTFNDANSEIELTSEVGFDIQNIHIPYGKVFHMKTTTAQPVVPQSDINAHLDNNVSWFVTSGILKLTVDKVNENDKYYIDLLDFTGNSIAIPYDESSHDLNFHESLEVDLNINSDYSGIAFLHLTVNNILAVKQIAIQQ